MCVGDGETYERSAIEEHIRVKQVMLAGAQEELDKAKAVLEGELENCAAKGETDIDFLKN